MSPQLSAALLKRLASLFAMPIRELDGVLLMADDEEVERHAAEFAGDPTGLEAFVNHYHLVDFVSGLTLDPKTERRQLRRLGIAVITVWSERMAQLLGDRSALFYLGGKDDVIVRFHIERPGVQPWAPLDEIFLRKEKMSVFRANRSGLKRII